MFGLFSRNKRQPQTQPIQPKYQNQLYADRYCKIHKVTNYDTSTCPFCVSALREDKRAKIYPPGINDNNVDSYQVEDWIAIEHINERLRAGEITKEEAYAEKKAYINSDMGPLGRIKRREEMFRREREELEARRKAYY